jgi:hypothetical protein
VFPRNGKGEQMEEGEQADYVVATYDEIRMRFSLGGTDHARIKAKRRKWAMEPRNNPGSLARIRVPRAEWDAVEAKARSRGTAPEERGDRPPGTAPPGAEQSRKINPLEGLIAAFREEQGQLRGDLAETKAAAEKAQAELVAERIRATKAEGERDAARIMAALAEGEVRTWRDKLEAAEARADRLEMALLDIARQSTAEAARSLSQAAQEPQPPEPRRSFWRRWIG